LHDDDNKKKPKIDYFGNEFKQICMMMTIKKNQKDYFGNEFKQICMMMTRKKKKTKN
jgi:hypothetical protein